MGSGFSPVRPFLFWHWLFKRGEAPVPLSKSEHPDLVLLPKQNSGEKVLYDDGRVRVTPEFVQIGNGRKIVVSKIRELRQGLIREAGLGGFIYRNLLILFFSGTVIFGLMQNWIYFAVCLGGWAWTLIGSQLRPYVLSIHMAGSLGEYIEFSDRQAVDACGKAIEAAIKSRA